MATDTFGSSAVSSRDFELNDTVKAILKPLASLRLTVALFALGIFIIFVGTLAQVEKDMWEVIELYFRSWVAMIDLQIFFPRTWWPDLVGKVNGSFPVPGGATIGALMVVNLLSAHLVRFKIQAKGPELLMGLVVIGLGSLVTYWVIASGHNQSGLQGKPPFSWEMLWTLVRGSLFLMALTSGVALAISGKASQTARIGMLAAAIVFGALGVWSATTIPSASSLRILWQLIQGGLAGVVLLVGCMLAFKKRAGIVLLHVGIGLIMFSEFYVSQKAVEGRMSIREGETMNYVRDIRETEVAIVRSSEDSDSEEVTVIPGSRLLPKRSLLGLGGPVEEHVLISDEKLPFDIEVLEYIKNANLGSIDLVGIAEELDYLSRTQRMQVRRLQAVDDAKEADILVNEKFLTKDQLTEVQKIRGERIAKNRATVGAGTELVAEEARAATGTDGGNVDLAAVYVNLRKKGAEESLGKFMLSQILTMNDRQEEVEVGEDSYEVSLRFKRTYKDYSLSLKDVRKDDYLGTNTPMNYSSDVVVMDNSANSKVGDFKIWMNNPLRYAGETFYQSGYTSKAMGGGVESTDLQVVTNGGWMMPYVGCMLVTVGMLVHFSGTLWRFLSRISRQEVALSESTKSSRWDALIPALFVLLFAFYVGSKMRPPTDTKANMRIHDFASLPVVYQGRVKPMDTLARNTLRIISNKETVDDFAQYDPKKRRQPQLPAIRWLMDVMAGSPDAEKHPVFRIDSLEVLDTLGLPRRKGFRYSLAEFREKIPVIEAELKAMPKEQEDRSFYQRKIVELERRLRAQRLIEVSFARIIPQMPTEAEVKADPDAATRTVQQIQRMLASLSNLESALDGFQPPLAVPMPQEDSKPGREWVAFSTAWNEKYGADLFASLNIDPAQARLPKFKSTQAAQLWDKMLMAYATGKTKPFNDTLDEYRELLNEQTPENLDVQRIGFEHFFNYSRPFYYSVVMYVVAFALVALGWAAAPFGKFRIFNRCAFWLLVFTFLLHTFALGARVYISGRPPVTNLYSSAVFIGWVAVGFALTVELIFSKVKALSSYAMGLGNLVAAVAGYSTLLIAYQLAADGDTFTVLQAVLDTQFWLATHVVCITFGYSTTFLAGAFGIVYLLTLAWRNPKLSSVLTSITYGTLCFAIFFSFVGTVLGGLWADDSWGRFWGWDPKENGALIIVLWNALILHARWGGMVRDKGLAVLAVLGNITTAWSWFGVNELGVGLHSYGFTEGVLRNLSLFVLSQLIIVTFGLTAMSLLPRQRDTSPANS